MQINLNFHSSKNTNMVKFGNKPYQVASEVVSEATYNAACKQLDAFFRSFRTQKQVSAFSKTTEPLKVIGEYIQQKLGLSNPLNLKLKYARGGKAEGCVGDLYFNYNGKKGTFLIFQGDNSNDLLQYFKFYETVPGVISGKFKVGQIVNGLEIRDIHPVKIPRCFCK